MAHYENFFTSHKLQEKLKSISSPNISENKLNSIYQSGELVRRQSGGRELTMSERSYADESRKSLMSEAPSQTSTEILDKLYDMSTRISLAIHVWHSADVLLILHFFKYFCYTKKKIRNS
jgi:hypothetical protein